MGKTAIFVTSSEAVYAAPLHPLHSDVYLTMTIYFWHPQKMEVTVSRKLLFAIAAFFLGLGQIWAETANGPAGIWLTQAGDARVRVSHCGTGLCGTIVWLKVPIDPATGKPHVDDKNANRSLAKRPVIGINIFSGMRSVTNNKWSGTIYNADDGKSYSSDVIFAGPRKLEVRGCVMSVLCGGETWTKIGDVTVAIANQ